MKNHIYTFGLTGILVAVISSFSISLTKTVTQPDAKSLSLEVSDPHLITIVDMIPELRSDETNNDSEPNIAVNPRDPNIIAASAFTFTSRREGICGPSPCVEGRYPSCRAPIYLSFDGGLTWRLEEVLESNNGITHDITLAFGPSGHLYASFLQGCYAADNVMKGFMTMRSVRPITQIGASSLFEMVTVDKRFWENSTNDNYLRNLFDQPWVVATTDGSNDKVFIGVNRVGESRSIRTPSGIGNGRTARVIVSPNGTDTFGGVSIERANSNDRNLSAIRVAAHSSGVAYAVFQRWVSGGMSTGAADYSSLHPTCDIIVVRDDNYGRSSFSQLLNGGVGSAIGKRVASGLVPLSNPSASDTTRRLLPGSSLGRARLVGSNLSIAVDPRDGNHVVVAWCALDAGAYTLHTSESRDAGRSWTPLFTDKAYTMNPALAISSDGMIGLLYQQLTTIGSSYWWVTHFTSGVDRMSSQDYVLNQFPNDSLPVLNRTTVANRPSLGDYVDLEAVGNTFYGVFSAFNMPGREMYSSTTRYARRLSDASFTSPDGRRVRYSVDPFFFKVEPNTGALPASR